MATVFGKLNLKDQPEIHVLAAPASFEPELGRLSGVRIVRDAVVWFAYPKKSSKNYECEFDRDTGWASVGEAGFEPVRMVAIDDDWSALRFRRPEFIKKMTRGPKYTLTKEGRAKARKSKR